MYFGGLLIGLAAGVALYQAKKAMMPKFHEVQDTRAAATISPGGGVRFSYGGDEPGYFLIPGLPTSAVLWKKAEDGKLATAAQLGYSQLVEKGPLLGPVTEEGDYQVAAEFFICAEPGVADCTKLVINEDIHVDRNAPESEARIELNLPALAQEGLKAGGGPAAEAGEKAE
jgi:hypothetical protein